MSNITGARGEKAVEMCLMREIDGWARFSPKFLGDKTPLLDCVVNLLNEEELEIGPFFMIQVKTTKVAGPNKSIPVECTADEVFRALNRKVPVYLVAVDESVSNDRQIFFVAIDSQRSKGVRAVSRTHSLSCDETLKVLYDEVVSYHDRKGHDFVSKFAGSKL